MRKFIVVVLALLLISQVTYGQSWTPGTGKIYVNPTSTKVGIGTAIPKHNLEVEGTIETDYLYPSGGSGNPYRYLRFGDLLTFWAGFMWNYNGEKYGDGDDFSIYTYDDRDITFYTGTGNVIMFPLSGGNVGIGLTNPSSKLHVEYNKVGQVSEAELSAIYGHNSGSGGGYDNPIGVFGAVNAAGGKAVCGYNYNSGGYGGYFLGRGYFSGKVGIGTYNPGDYELAVNGEIRAKEIKVETGWSDFVFADNYQLMPLDKLANYIKANRSLPGIPKEKEVLKEGVALGEMQAKLLAKVEELTLYVIDQNKEIRELKKENEELKERISTLERQ